MRRLLLALALCLTACDASGYGDNRVADSYGCQEAIGQVSLYLDDAEEAFGDGDFEGGMSGLEDTKGFVEQAEEACREPD
jgi:hypothetical protein